MLDSYREKIADQECKMRAAKNYLRENPWWLPGMKRGLAKGSIYWADKKLPILERDYRKQHISLNVVQGLVRNLDPSIEARVFW